MTDTTNYPTRRATCPVHPVPLAEMVMRSVDLSLAEIIEKAQAMQALRTRNPEGSPAYLKRSEVLGQVADILDELEFDMWREAREPTS